jgi:hypothetical protein
MTKAVSFLPSSRSDAQVGRGWEGKEGVGEGGEMTQTLYAHMNKKKKKI